MFKKPELAMEALEDIQLAEVGAHGVDKIEMARKNLRGQAYGDLVWRFWGTAYFLLLSLYTALPYLGMGYKFKLCPTRGKSKGKIKIRSNLHESFQWPIMLRSISKSKVPSHTPKHFLI